MLFHISLFQVRHMYISDDCARKLCCKRYLLWKSYKLCRFNEDLMKIYDKLEKRLSMCYVKVIITLRLLVKRRKPMKNEDGYELNVFIY